ncbi:Oidioi.mRNA.OKI2018_I69.PAR.g10252.t1.cds [Oikopleura dioica]|uniref:Oidioi.mRNA.OKI2018_I69.PAR.g10252.t1.cds n=1 Tax=Oikopleura dioica TaxID=34765 RepID=A0ABN7RXJ9_OIKDI|nr:Oidioi.mRNA.OKI2018_I69.PAR.g10252.t1.cds [Oikopleura dioica]
MDAENNFTYYLRCVGPCRNNNEPFSVKESESTGIKTGNVGRHAKRYHAPLTNDSNEKEREMAKVQEDREQAAVHFRPRRKISKKVIAKFCDSAVSLVSDKHVSFRLLESEQFEAIIQNAFVAGGGNPDDSKQLDVSYNKIRTILFTSHLEMLNFLQKVLPILAKRGAISLEIDTKYTGRTTSGDLEVSALGTLLVFYDSTTDKRVTYLLQYAPITDKTDVACAMEVEEALAEYGIKDYQRLLGVICDGGQRGVAEYISIKAAICGAHSGIRAFDGMIQNAESYASLDSDLHKDFLSFVSHCRNGLFFKEKKKLKLEPTDFSSVNQYFAHEDISEDEKERIFKLRHDTSEMTADEIKKRAAKIQGFPLITSDNGIRWNKKEENLKVLVSWSPKLEDLSKSDHPYAYLIPQRVSFPDLDFIKSLSFLTSDLMKYVRILEHSESKVSDQLLIFEEMLIYCTKENDKRLTSIRQKQFHAKLRQGLFIKLMKMIFGGFYESEESFVDGKEPARATDLNLACLYLTPSKYTCSFRRLRNELAKGDAPIFARNIKLVEKNSAEFMKKGKDFIWHMDKELKEVDDKEKQTTPEGSGSSSQLNPNDDFKIVKSAASLTVRLSPLEEEYVQYEGKIGSEEWEEITGGIVETSPHFIHKKLTAFWKAMSTRFPRLSAAALQCINCPGSSCDLEREFSQTTRDSMDPCRNRLKNETILFIRQFRDAQKLKTAILQYCRENNIKFE